MAVHDNNKNDNSHDEAKNCTDTYEASVQFIERVTSNCDEIQTRVLEEILSQNVKTEYLKRHGISHGCIDRETYKSKVPLIKYEDIKPDILRIYKGDFSPILCAQLISELWISSGTSEGHGKLVPATDDEMHRRNELATSVITPYTKRRIEGSEPNQGKVFSLLITRKEIVTPGGLLARPGMNSILKNPKFYSDKPFPSNHNTSPIEAVHCSDHLQSIYAQLLCAIYQRHDVTHIKALFCSNLVWAVNFLKSHFSELCHDISHGRLSDLIIDTTLRSYMVKTFMQNPNPELANVIKNACTGENWEGIIQKIWPNVEYLETIATGSMAQYIPLVKYYSGGLPLMSVKYGSSECDLGFNLNPTCDPYDATYTIMPNMAYYEFIPLESMNYSSSNSQLKTVDMANVEVGKEYEIVVTTYAGLYRYRLGDVLSPTSFYNSTPQFKFIRKRDVLLSIDVSVTTEIDLQNAIHNASALLHPFDTKVVEYTSYADVNNIPCHYVIYLELTTINREYQRILEQCCSAMEGAFDVHYKTSRVAESIGPLEIRVVNNGTFEKLRDYAISKGASFIQYKVPRCVKLLPMVELLNSEVVSTHFSPCVPDSAHKLISDVN